MNSCHEEDVREHMSYQELDNVM
eukprot:gene25993-biopygen12729